VIQADLVQITYAGILDCGGLPVMQELNLGSGCDPVRNVICDDIGHTHVAGHHWARDDNADCFAGSQQAKESLRVGEVVDYNGQVIETFAVAAALSILSARRPAVQLTAAARAL